MTKKPRILSAADLEGSEVVDAPRVLSPADLEGSEVVAAERAAQTWTPEAVAAARQGDAAAASQASADAALVDAQRPKTGAAEAFGRGALQGVTAGFSDEIGGALGSAFSDKTYSEVRDDIRAGDKLAASDRPGWYAGGEVAGGLATAAVPGTGVIRGTSGWAGALRGAVQGGTQALGRSDADLTKGEYGAAAKDVAFGTGAGAVLGRVFGTGRTVGEAAERADQRLLSDLGKRATKTQRDRLVGIGGEKAAVTAQAARELGLAKHARAPEKLVSLAKPITQRLGARFGRVDEVVQREAGGITEEQAKKAFVGLQKRLRNNPQGLEASKNVGLDLVARFQREGGPIPVNEFRQFVSNASARAWDGGVKPSIAKKTEREISGALGGVLKDHIKQAASKSEAVAKATRGYERLTRQYGAAKDILEAAQYRARLEKFQMTGLRDVQRENPTILGTVKGAARELVEPARRVRDEALARLQRAAEGGKAPPALARIGISSDAVQKAAQAARAAMTAAPRPAIAAAGELASPVRRVADAFMGNHGDAPVPDPATAPSVPTPITPEEEERLAQMFARR